MPKAALVGIDTAGGVITGALNTTLQCTGAFVAVVGDSVAGHGEPPHNGPTMVEGSAKLMVKGIPVCLAGHRASCSHGATGSAKLEVSS